MNEIPAAVGTGVSRDRDRMWGLIGGVLGVGVGLGSAAIAVFVEGADPLSSTSPYPAFFAKRQLLVYDVFLAGVILSSGSRSPSRGSCSPDAANIPARTRSARCW